MCKINIIDNAERSGPKKFNCTIPRHRKIKVLKVKDVFLF